MSNQPLKILILSAYYNRPKLVLNMLNSIVKANEHHQNWHLVFGDDGSHIPGKPIVVEALKDHLDRVTFIESNLTFEDKAKQGLLLGRYANEVMDKSDADVAIMLCDDDALYPTYLRDLSKFYIDHPEVLYAYSYVHLFNPLFQPPDGIDNATGKFNQWHCPIDPVGKVDASQVSWRLDCFKKFGARFAETTKRVDGKPWENDTDRSFFESLVSKCGLCHPTHLIGQYKAIHDYQLVWHKKNPAEFNEICNRLAGEVF